MNATNGVTEGWSTNADVRGPMNRYRAWRVWRWLVMVCWWAAPEEPVCEKETTSGQ